MSGKLIVFEGANEVGKSTLAALLFTEFRRKGIESELIAFPGNTEGTLGRHIYELHHGFRRLGIARVNSTSLQLLHIAAHVDAIEHVILPALKSGRTVVLDRFWWSTAVYGSVTGADSASIGLMLDIERHHWRDTAPDLTILVKRTAPVTPLYERSQWARIVELYDELALRESASSRVEVVRNDGPVDATFDKLRSLVPNVS